MIPPNNTPTGDCQKGYKGILCSDCENDYSRSSSFECQKCPEKYLNAIRVVGIMIAFLIFSVFLIKSTLKGAIEKKNVISVF